MSLQVVALGDRHLADAARLVSARYRALREEVASLPPRYENEGVILPMLRDFGGGAPGVAAIQDGRLVGFLRGTLIREFRGKRAIISPEWANGAQVENSRRIYEMMYSHLSQRWVANGCFVHLVGMLAHDRRAIEGWHWLGFGMIAADAVRDLGGVRGPIAAVEIRRAVVAEAGTVAAMSEATARHLAAAPAFLPYVDSEDRARHQAWLSEPANAAWLAVEEGRVVGFLKHGPASHGACDIIQDEKTTSIVGAFTEQAARGRGIGAALVNRAIEWARTQGYERCAVDFEPMNVPAARFWTRHFQPVAYALVRHVNEQIAWAHADREDKDVW